MPPTPIPSPSWLTLIILSIFSRLKKSLLRTPHKSSNVSMPSYSVLIPAYNEGELIPEALRSCANQTIKPERVIILDDLSTATDYHAIISEVYPSAEIIRAEKRQGKAYNITKYVNVVSSDYVLVLDADSY